VGKYEPLAERLRSHPEDEWTATFGDIEKVLGFPLPASARTYREWWANQRGEGHSQKKGWQDAGWQVSKVALAHERVTFRRVSNQVERGGANEGDSLEELMDRAGGLLGTADRDRIVREALRGLIQREAARRLAALGGTMPGFKAPPRRRFPS
jgi:hypothetical protein